METLEQKILNAASGDPKHGVPYAEILQILDLREDEQEEFQTTWKRLMDRGRLTRTSRGYKAAESAFGRGYFT